MENNPFIPAAKVVSFPARLYCPGFPHIVNKTTQFTVCKKTWAVEPENEATTEAGVMGLSAVRRYSPNW